MTTLLLVDDEPRIAGNLARALERRGFRCLTADCTREALAILAEREGEIDGVVTDWHMPPGPSGIWLLENVMLRWPHIRRVLFTGRTLPHAERLNRLGLTQDVLRKPLVASQIAALFEVDAEVEVPRSEAPARSR